ncbi:MAG: hypothetical protein K2N14_04955 [Clostridia bacterium]|nr:hypothetical protein [Clostridia bacterium]
MKILKKILMWFANPKWYFLLIVMLIAIGSTVGGTLILTQDKLSEYMIWGYVLLGVMAVTVSYSIFGIIRIYPDAKAGILKWSEKHPRLNRAFNEDSFTTLFLTACSLIVTLAFAVYNGAIALGIAFSKDVDSAIAIWFGALAAYYIVLIILRGSILIYHGKRKKAALKGQSEMQTLINDGKLYRACGIMLFLLPVCLSFAILQMVRADASFEHKGITIYVYAIYAFFKIITAVYSFIKERHNPSMTIMATKNIKLADAFVSILALQTAMFREFNIDNPEALNAPLMNAVTGAAVCALTIAIGVYMIIKATMRIKNLKQAEVLTSGGQSDDNGTKNDA